MSLKRSAGVRLTTDAGQLPVQQLGVKIIKNGNRIVNSVQWYWKTSWPNNNLMI